MGKRIPDAQAAKKHLRALDQAVENLARHRGCSLQKLLADTDRRWTVERGLQICVQQLLHTATYIVPGGDSDIEQVLAQLAGASIVPSSLAERLQSIGRLYSDLLGGLKDVDIGALHTALSEQLGDFRIFSRHIAEHLGD